MAGTAPYYDNERYGGPSGIRYPQEAGKATFMVDKNVSHSYASGTADWNMNPEETAGSVYSVILAGGAANAIFPALVPGKHFVVNNGSGQTITFKVTGKTGIAVVNLKAALLFMDSVAGDVQRVTADTTPTS
jgi:hypothetical protein